MENNVNFDKDLKLFYLSSLAENDCKDVFLRFYHSIENYIEEIVKDCEDLVILNRVKNIISYRTRIMEKKI